MSWVACTVFLTLSHDWQVVENPKGKTETAVLENPKGKTLKTVKLLQHDWPVVEKTQRQNTVKTVKLLCWKTPKAKHCKNCETVVLENPTDKTL